MVIREKQHFFKSLAHIAVIGLWFGGLLFLPTAGHAGQRWAVVVGVNDYGGNTVSLHYAEKDAQRFRDLVLRDTPANHVRFLTTAGSDEDKPTGANIVGAVRQLMGKAGPDDAFWFF